MEEKKKHPAILWLESQYENDKIALTPKIIKDENKFNSQNKQR